jgi:hypothetical protein
MIINPKTATLKAAKIMPKSFISGVPYSTSMSRNRNTASRKKEKYAMKLKAKMTDTQNGITRTEKISTMIAKIRSIIPLSYLEASLDARPV